MTQTSRTTDGETYLYIAKFNAKNRHYIYEWTDKNTGIEYCLVRFIS